MRGMNFADEIGEYVVLTLALDDFEAGGRPRPAGLVLAGGESRAALRAQERALLRRAFRRWLVPYLGLLPGWRRDSPIYAVEASRLVGALYLCDENEFGLPGFGQIHYGVTTPGLRGGGRYRAAFSEAVARARAWGLAGLVLNSDRHLLPEVYVRWGAKPYSVVPKGARFAPLTAVRRIARAVRSRLRRR
jgi:hypothetical protein